MIKPSECTVIIPHLGADEQQRYALTQCTESLDETVPEIKKIIAVNGGGYPLDGGVSISGNWERIELTEQGQCKATNAAVATTNTPWIFVTNDDMVFSKNWWDKLNASITDQACISPRLVEPRDGAPTFIKYFCGGAGGDFDKQKFEDFVKDNDAPAVVRTGFNLPFLIKRELWDLIGEYDIEYDPFSSNSDSDLEYKIKLAGVQPYQSMYSFVYHFSQTSGTFHPDNQSYWQKNWDYFIQKWGFPRTDDGIWEADFLIPTPEQGRIFCPPWEGKYDGS